MVDFCMLISHYLLHTLNMFSSCYYEDILLLLTTLNTLDQVTLWSLVTLRSILTQLITEEQHNKQRVKCLRHHSENPGAVQSVTRQRKDSPFPCKAPELGLTTREGISAWALHLCTGFAVFLEAAEKGQKQTLGVNLRPILRGALH